MTERMLRFVNVPQQMPEKRTSEERRADFSESIASLRMARPRGSPAAVVNAACRSVQCTARCTTTFRIG